MAGFSVLSAGSPLRASGQGKGSAMEYISKINEKFTGVVMKMGTSSVRVPREDEKVHLVINKDWLDQMHSDEDTELAFDESVEQLADVKDFLSKKFEDDGKTLRDCKFYVDGKGNLTVSGNQVSGTQRSGLTETNFRIDLGNILKENVDLKTSVEEQFKIQGFRLMDFKA